jgi:hypothetical protein
VLNARIALSLPSPKTLLYALLVITALLIAIIVARPSITVSTTGKMLAFVAFCALPVLCGSVAAPICTPGATPRSSSCF